MSLRTEAKQLGISPAYLSYMINGKRPWRADIYARYRQLAGGLSVNKSVNSAAIMGSQDRHVVGLHVPN